MDESDKNKKRSKRKAASIKEWTVAEWTLGVSIANLAILTITMVAVIIYAIDAGKQNKLIGAESRPFVYGNGVKTLERTPDGVPDKVQVRFKNFGRSMAITAWWDGHIVVQAADLPAPVDPSCRESYELPKDAGGNLIPPDIAVTPEWVPLPAQNLSDVKYGKVLYVVGCIYYFGLDRTETYFSDLCNVWAPKAPQEFQPCGEPNRNHPK